MSGVWILKNNGVVQLVEKWAGEQHGVGRWSKRKTTLVHVATGQVVSSYSELEEILNGLGWERYYNNDDPNLLEFHKRYYNKLISLPKDFANFKSVHMYDIVVKNPNIFYVRDM